jgi:ribosomal protein L37AE/L43A
VELMRMRRQRFPKMRGAAFFVSISHLLGNQNRKSERAGKRSSGRSKTCPRCGRGQLRKHRSGGYVCRKCGEPIPAEEYDKL